MKPIVHIPNDVLTHAAKPVKKFDRRLATLVADMKEALTKAINPKGVGLAAPQVGVSLRVFLMRPKEKDEIRVFINPEITNSTSEETKKQQTESNTLEGCLSIPKIWGKVNRAQTLTLKYCDTTGQSHTETFSGFPATIIQHEIDHLDGILFTRRVLEQKEKLYQAAKDEQGKEVLEEITIK